MQGGSGDKQGADRQILEVSQSESFSGRGDGESGEEFEEAIQGGTGKRDPATGS